MLSGVVQSRSLEPSNYLENLKILITKKQEELNKSALSLKKSVEVLDVNTELMKQKLITLEEAKQVLKEQVSKNNELINKNVGNDGKVNELEIKNKELQQETLKLENEISDKLGKINLLELSIEKKEQEWDKNKSFLLNQLIEFQENQLLPGLNEIEKVIKLTGSKIDGANTKLTTYMSIDMDMEPRQDPFKAISDNFKEKFKQNSLLFGKNEFGNGEYEDNEENEDVEENEDIDEDEDVDEEESDDESKINFGIDDPEENLSDDESEY